MEIQSVDPVHDKRYGRGDGGLRFRLSVSTEIASNGVAFADPDESDALEVFVLTTTGELYTLTFKRDLLARETVPTEFDPSTCVKAFSSSTLHTRRAYRMVAISSLEIIISLQDGSLVQLKRQAKESGTHWRETFFSDGNWSDTIRGLVSLRRHQTVPFGNIDLEPNTAAAIAKSPDGRHIWTVSLDHELRAWSTETGKTVAAMDLLGARHNEEERKHQRYTMSAEQGTLMQIVTPPKSEGVRNEVEENGTYYIVLRSPKDNQLKFYEVEPPAAHGHRIAINDVHILNKLIPPIDELMDTNLWHLEEFRIHPGVRWMESQLWIRARIGKVCRIFTLTFDLYDTQGNATDLESIWQTGWTVVEPGLQRAEALQLCTDFPGDLDVTAGSAATSPNERWLNFLFSPGRFSTASVETALTIYRKGRGLPSKSDRKGLGRAATPLMQSLIEAVASKIILKRLPNEQPDFVKYQANIQAEWRTFYSLLRDLHTRRSESIGFALDLDTGLTWSVCADYVAPVRATSHFETLLANEHLLETDALERVDETVRSVVFPTDESPYSLYITTAASAFWARLSDGFRLRFRKHVLEEALGHESGDQERNRERVKALYDTNNFGDEVMDDDFQALESSAQWFGGLGDLTDNAILGVIELMQQQATGKSVNGNQALSRYGDFLAIEIAREILERNRRILLELLTMVVFVYGDLDQEDLHQDFVSQIGPIYDALITRLKHNEMLYWLARNEVQEPWEGKGTKASIKSSGSISLLTRIFIGDWKAVGNTERDMAELLTQWNKHWIEGPQLWDEWDGTTGHIMAFLIKDQAFELAADFRKFISRAEDSSSWLRYLEGKLFVAIGEYAEASLMFRAAASGMAEARDVSGADTANLLSAEEKNYFGTGQSRFYQHISDIFDKLRIFSYAADFASLALEHLEGGEDFGSSLAEIDRRKAMTDSPAASRVDNAREEIQILREMDSRSNELHVRLFTSLVETGRFGEAFNALSGITEKPLRSANLGKLIRACTDKNLVDVLLKLPFEQGDLVREADAILLGLAKKSLASGSGKIPFYQILYAFRTQQSDFRGAAEILHEYLERLRYTQAKHGIIDPDEETLIQAYVLLINTLACCGEEEAWLLADPIEGVHGSGKKRRLVTIADIRKEYEAELDKRSDIRQGRFPLVGGGDEMDVL